MNLVTYGLIEEAFILKLNVVKLYGVVAYKNIGSDNELIILDSIRNISTNKELVQCLIDKCNKYNLSIIHLEDVVNDMINL